MLLTSTPGARGALAPSPAAALLLPSPETSRREQGAAGARSLLPLVVLAVLLAFADGFWIISLRGAIGALDRVQSPFGAWWHDSALMLPVFLAAVAAPVSLVRRRRARSAGSARGTVLRTGLLITACSTAVGIAWAICSSAVDYLLQTTLLEQRATLHTGAAEHVVTQAAGHAVTAAQLAQERHATLATHVLGVEQATGVLLLTNVLLVLWYAALRGGELDM